MFVFRIGSEENRLLRQKLTGQQGSDENVNKVNASTNKRNVSFVSSTMNDSKTGHCGSRGRSRPGRTAEERADCSALASFKDYMKNRRAAAVKTEKRSGCPRCRELLHRGLSTKDCPLHHHSVVKGMRGRRII